jgi:DNA-binding NarL/FixJ family response regulator
MEGDRDLKRLDVLVVEDQPRIRASLVELLEGSGRVRVVGAAATGEEALELLPEMAPEVILCDLGLPGIDGVEVTRRGLRVAPTAQVLLFTVFEEEEQVLAAIQAGAAGYLLKGAPPEKIVEALEEVHAGGTVIQPTLARRLLRHLVPDPATVEAPLPSP